MGTIEDLGQEIETYLNENNKKLSYRFISASEKVEETGINVLSFSVQFHNIIGNFMIDFSLPKIESELSTKKGHVFRLQLQAITEEPKLNQSLIGWIKSDINRAQAKLQKH